MPFLFFILLGIDLFSKRIALKFSQELGLTIIFNKGMAFGLLGNFSWLVLLLNILVLGGLYLIRKKFFYTDKILKTALSFIMAGGLGNFLDRVYLEYVIDFIKIPYFPYFNLADIFINIGIILVIIRVITFNEHTKI